MGAINGRVIYSPKGKAGEYAENAANFYVGCSNGCTYCYLRKGWGAKVLGGNTPELKNYYEKNARNLITTWGGRLNDYASRTWAGLIKDYYSKRWDMYLDAVVAAVENNREFDQEKLDGEFRLFEDSWVSSTRPVEVTPEGDLLIYARFLLNKYKRKIN